MSQNGVVERTIELGKLNPSVANYESCDIMAITLPL